MTRWRTPGLRAGQRAAAFPFGAATAVATLSLCGCNLFTGHQEVKLPGLPAAWQHFSIVLQLTAVDGRDGTGQRLPDAVPGSAIVLPVGRHRATVVLAEPVIVGPAGTRNQEDTRNMRPPGLNMNPPVRLRPAGAVVPLDAGNGAVLQVSWERGVLASLIVDLWRGGADPSILNIERLDRELRERAGTDPWALDRSRILASLQAGEMSVAAIRPLRTHTVNLTLPAGRWAWWDPWATPLHSNGRTAFTIQLPAGYHLLIHDSGAARAVQVSDDGTVLITSVADSFAQ